MSGIGRDVRYGLQVMWRGRGTTGLAVLAFALGIGTTTAVFSLFYGVLIKPLPYPHPEQLVMVFGTQPACATCPASYPEYTAWRTRNHVFSAVGGSTANLFTVTGSGEPERVRGSKATWTLLDVFGITPELGRWFTEAEDAPNGPAVAVISDGLWTRRFGRRADILGRTITLDGTTCKVVGVMPPTFSHRDADAFVPVARANDPATVGNHFLATYARLAPGVTPARAQREMVDLGGVLAREFGTNHGIDVESYPQLVVGNLVQPLRVLMGAVSLVLLIACANIANLLLASGLQRRRELAVRAALGATRWALARQLTIESLVLAVVGGLLGLGLAGWALAAFTQLAADILPRTASVHLDAPVVGFAVLLSLVTGVFCGLWPVLRLGTRSLAAGVREGDLRSGGDTGGRRFGNGLVVVEVALAFSLLVGAGLLVKNLLALEHRDTGFTTDHVITFDVAPVSERYQADEPLTIFYDGLLERLRAIPGVVHAGVTSHLPMYDYGWNGDVSIEGGNPWAPDAAPLVEDRWIGGDYLGALGMRLVRGRAFDSHDRAGATPVVILNERTAEKFWPGQDPIGRHVRKGTGNGSPWMAVVGVVHDVRSYGLRSAAPYELYTPIDQSQFGAMTVALRTASDDTGPVIARARRAVAEIDPNVPVSHVQTMVQVVAASVDQPRLVSTLTVVFGALAGLLAAVGVYGVMAYNVRRERRAHGIRLALGADPSRVRRLVIVRGLVLGGLGVVIGAGGALLLTRTLQSLLSDVTPTDPVVFAGTAATLLVICVLAGYLPARQAARTDPIVVLRTE